MSFLNRTATVSDGRGIFFCERQRKAFGKVDESLRDSNFPVTE